VKGSPYVAVRVEGGLLPEDLIGRIAGGDKELPGNRPEDYHLAVSERLGDAASRKWDYLRGAYTAFRDRLAMLPETDPGTTQTRDRWLQILLGELGWGRVPYVRGIDADGKRYPIGFRWGEHIPLHLVGWHTDLDRSSGKGETGRAPQSLLQEFLNVSDGHLWGVLSNGRQLRILRDSTSLVGSAYVEFDLEAIFDGELYAEFYLLFALLHASRFELLPREDAASTPADCWLEKWRAFAEETGTRAREQLRVGVEEALGILGTGFLTANPSLRSQLADGKLTLTDFHHELLRLAYQLIFLFVAEDRGALLDPSAPEDVRDRYAAYFSTDRLRRLAARRRGDRHGDLWRTFVLVLDALGADEGRPELGLPGLGGLFFTIDPVAGSDPAPDLLRGCELPNDALLTAVRLLSEVRDRRGRRRAVDYRHLGAEELGSIYESLLELVARHDPAGPRFWLESLAGNERKTTGSYYTPSSLIEALLDTALDPLIHEHAASGDPEHLLKITVCDPACGSGHFLVAAARRIAKKYAAMYHGDEEPTPQHVREALHKVVATCIYGVDLNPLAAELAKVSLWLESLEPGKPLAFLDAHIKVGNSLLGTTPKLLAEGIPDGAFKLIEGDDNKIVASLKKQNARERDAGQDTLFGDEEVVRVGNADLSQEVGRLAAMRVSSLADVRRQARSFKEFEQSPELRRRKRIADAWCAAFVWRKHADAPPAITTSTLRMLDSGEVELSDTVAEELDDLAEQYRFFHWYLEFPDIFSVDHGKQSDLNPEAAWHGGFTCVIGNPPWERVKLQEQEFFAARHPKIATAPNAAARKKLIKALATSVSEADRELDREFRDELRRTAGWSHVLRETGRYPLTGHGDINTYAVFAETGRTITGSAGRMGLIVPTGIATDATTAPFFRDLIEQQRLDSLLDFVTNPQLWTDVGNRRYRFSILVITGRAATVEHAEFATLTKHPDDLPPRGSRIRVAARDLLLVNPNTGTCPMFQSQRDADLTLDIYRRVPVLWRDDPQENPWKLSFLRMFDMANDSGLFRTQEDLESDGWKLAGNVFVKGEERYLPLYEAKLIHHFDHRLACYSKRPEGSQDTELPRLDPDEKADPSRVPIPKYWIISTEVDKRLSGRWSHDWLLGWRDIARSTDERTMVCALLPRVAVGHKFPLALPFQGGVRLVANLSSFVLDYIARQKFAGTSMAYFVLKQLPVLPTTTYEEPCAWDTASTLASWIETRVLELSYTAWDMEPFAQDLNDEAPPFVWNADRRFAIRAELDTAYFHLYGINRDDVGYIMDSFGAFQRNDPDRFARTRSLILNIYDAMAAAIETGKPYETVLDPPPGQGPRHPDTRPH
jgi:Eco57I restriction-modification methylase